MKEHIVYKYTYDGEVIYVGKTDRSLKLRVDAHAREESFSPYLGAEIEYCELSNEVETDSVEKILINYYKPVINIKDKVPLLTDGVSLPNLEWNSYKDYKPLVVRLDAAKTRAAKAMQFLNALEYSGGKQFFLPFIPEVTSYNGKKLVDVYVQHCCGQFVFFPTKEGLDLIRDDYDGIAYESFKFLAPYVQDSHISTLLFNFTEDVKKYIRSGYECEYMPIRYQLFIENKYEPILGIIEKITGLSAEKWGEMYMLEWARDHDEHLETLEKRAKYEAYKEMRKEDLVCNVSL